MIVRKARDHLNILPTLFFKKDHQIQLLVSKYSSKNNHGRWQAAKRKNHKLSDKAIFV